MGTEPVLLKLKCGRHALVDADDLDMVSGRSWYAQWRYREGAKHCITAIKCYDNGCVIVLHRMLLDAPQGFVVDHKNGDVLDNRKINLRLCTPAENAKNRKAGRLNTTGYKGVHKTGSGRWGSQIEVDGRRFWLGSFNSKEEAAAAYAMASKKHHGEFCRVA